MKHFPFLILLFLFSCSQNKAPELSKPNAPIPEYIPVVQRELPDPVVTDTIVRTQRVEVPVMWSWQDDSTQAKQIVQPGANLEAGAINVSGTFGPYKFTMTGTITLPTDVTVTPNEPEDTTSGGNDPPVVVPPAENLFAGTNTHPWVPLEKLTMFSSVRCYIASGWIWRPNGLFVQPMYQAETEYAHGLDDYFQRAKSLGIDVLPCINQAPDWLNGYTQGIGSNDYPPIKKGLERTKAENWKDYADFWYQFVCRYGSVKHPDSELKIDETPRWNGDIKNVKKSGLGLIKAVEIGNEYDRWWSIGTDQYLKPEEHAAMLAACYAACKKADPNITVVMAGITGFDLKYLQAMKAAFSAMGLPFQSDAINVHHYSSRFNEAGKWPPTWKNSSACLPADDKDFPTIYKVVEFGRLIGLQTWVTEFGADTRPPSWMHITLPGMTDEEAQGHLLVESYKAYKTAGVERCYSFMAADEPGNNGGLWQTCGILRNKESGYAEKPSCQMVKRMVEQFKAEKR